MNLTLKSLLKLAVMESSLLLLLLKSSLSKNSSLFLKSFVLKMDSYVLCINIAKCRVILSSMYYI